MLTRRQGFSPPAQPGSAARSPSLTDFINLFLTIAPQTSLTLPWVRVIKMRYPYAFPLQPPRATAAAAQPLKGYTILALDQPGPGHDMLYILCRRAGARLRRARRLQDIAAHLRLYRPDFVLIDTDHHDAGDSCGLAMLAQLAQRPELRLIAISDSRAQRQAALAAGAHACLSYPLPALAPFVAQLQALLPVHRASATLPQTFNLATSTPPLAAPRASSELLQRYLADRARLAQDISLWQASQSMALPEPDPSGLLALITERAVPQMPERL